LLRHIIGNPFRPYAGPRSWPFAIRRLAKDMSNGQDCRLPQSDALEEAGHIELAEHFRQEERHPKGCWALDLMLGEDRQCARSLPTTPARLRAIRRVLHHFFG
jgi:hypothetical protein